VSGEPDARKRARPVREGAVGFPWQQGAGRLPHELGIWGCARRSNGPRYERQTHLPGGRGKLQLWESLHARRVRCSTRFGVPCYRGVSPASPINSPQAPRMCRPTPGHRAPPHDSVRAREPPARRRSRPARPHRRTGRWTRTAAMPTTLRAGYLRPALSCTRVCLGDFRVTTAFCSAFQYSIDGVTYCG
jgi:hypothetical protein